MAPKEMSVIDHLDELRKRLLVVFISVFAVSIAAYSKVMLLVKFISLPLSKYKLDLVYFSMTEGFMTRLKLAIYIGIICMSPLIIYEAVAFINPGLTKKEKRFLYKNVFFLSLLFIIGIIFGYFTVLPYTLEYLLTYSTSYLNPILSGNMYFSFIGTFCIITGIIFTIPFFLIVISKIGVISSKNLRKFRKFIILGIVTLELSFIPSTGLITYAVLTLPVVILYEITIWIVYFIEKRRKSIGGI